AAVSDADLRKIEDESTNYIRQNSEVYTKDVPLATAREIRGVRAVFGETYPDPVRVVSVGVPVEDLLADVKKEEWSKVSIEFCGGTHVEKTGEIKELVIIEESGIAKGIRRIIAVTGQAAYDVQREAEAFSEQLTQLERMANGSEKEALARRVQVQLNELSVSTLAKSKLKEHFAKITKSILDHQKAALKAENKKVLDAVNDHFATHKDSKTAVIKVPISANSKAISEAIKTISSKNRDKSVYLLAADTEKVVHGCHVAEEAADKGASASEWTTAVTAAVGGKAGGKGATSLGQGTNVDKVDEGVELATKYLEKLGL
ncbi:Alanine--tRNA ligase, partial [Cryomyces antarcticus]